MVELFYIELKVKELIHLQHNKTTNKPNWKTDLKMIWSFFFKHRIVIWLHFFPAKNCHQITFILLKTHLPCWEIALTSTAGQHFDVNCVRNLKFHNQLHRYTYTYTYSSTPSSFGIERLSDGCGLFASGRATWKRNRGPQRWFFASLGG